MRCCRVLASYLLILTVAGMSGCAPVEPPARERDDMGMATVTTVDPPTGGGVAGGAAPAPGMAPSMPTDSSSAEPSTAGPEPAVSPADPGTKVFDAGSDPSRNNVTAGNVCTRLAQIQCAGEDFCCDNPGRDRATCEAQMLAGCMGELYLDAMTSNPITGFDPEAASGAFAEIERMASACDTAVASYGASPNGLMGMFRGSVDSGSSCSPGLAAASDMSRAAASLASCADISTTACLPVSTLSWSCEPRGQVGAECFTDLNCVDGLHCPNPEFDIGAATCQERKALGSPCQLPNECESLFCKAGSCVEASAQAAYCLAQ